MNQKSVYIITCGETEIGNDPYMTTDGMNAVDTLRRLISIQPKVMCGTGRRHRQMVAIFNLQVARFSILAGTADSFQTRDGNRCLVRANDSEIHCKPDDQSTEIWDDLERCIDASFVRRFLQSIAHDTAIFCDVELMHIIKRACRLEHITVKPATAYLLNMDSGGHIHALDLTTVPLVTH